MAAVWGFTGPPDHQLASSMARALRHRGGAQIQLDEQPSSTIGLRAERIPDGVGLLRSGLYSFDSTASAESPEGVSLALCGFLTGIEDARLSQSLEPSDVPLFWRQLADRIRGEGLSVVERLRGSFILVIRRGATLHLVRDASGTRSVYYGRCGGRWLFAIEPKGISTAPGFSRRVRPAALAQYLACSFVPGTGTMLEDLHAVPAGHSVSLHPRTPPRLERWNRFEAAEPLEQAAVNGRGDADWIRSFRGEMARAVRERLPARRPVGVFLSGGLDSSLVTAELARQVGGKNVRTWAIHFGPKYPNELSFARAVAERWGTEHEEVLIRPRDFLPRLRQMIWHLDDPIGDPITQPNFELASHVRGEVDYVFNGEGGDPCFGGPKNIPMMLHHWYGGVDRDPHFRERHYLQSYRRAWEEIQFLLSEDVRREIDEQRDLLNVFSPYLNTPVPRLFLNRLTAINIQEKGAHLILPKVERLLAAHGLTPLSPLFDERVTRFSFEMPARLKLQRGIEKVVLKEAYRDELPAEVISRPKSGMRVPVHYWCKGEMRRYVRRILSPRSVRRTGLFHPERVRQLLSYDIEEGRGRYGLRLWMLITFEIWRRIIVEGEAV